MTDKEYWANEARKYREQAEEARENKEFERADALEEEARTCDGRAR